MNDSAQPAPAASAHPATEPAEEPTGTRPRRRATGRPVGAWRAAFLVVEGKWTWYKRNWRATFFSSVGQPLLFLLALGLGIGSQVKPGSVPSGVSYLEYLAPALLVVAAVQNATGESTFPVLSSFKWQRVYWGINASPITPYQIVGGQLLWTAARLLLSGGIYLVVAAFFGGVRSPLVLLSLLFATLAGMAFAAPLVAYVATVDDEGQSLGNIFRFVLMPMTLFAGTFFPLDRLPDLVQPIAWITPLWHGTELARGTVLGGLELWPALGHAAYLLALLAGGAALAARNFRRRLAN
ncbi:ABC transporter permease [Crossiella sp. CA-258035]|uniref:ABC transporter permease n=1 Tax=Crossiella sp. CA-258035 TaxID=2981138 RepID=UPI0024BC38A7|nr:ABC transporter permease [Crossiella sp. CA-258035]WHT20824.1 ABC transporter permease [Crossiella sp. CA-258035]